MFDKERLKRIKLIVTDLDGTLLDKYGSIGDKTKRLIYELKQKGVIFTIASGRLHSALIKYAEELELSIPLISLDGCYIKNFSNDFVLFESFIQPKYVDKSIRLADKYLLNVALCHAEVIYYTERNSIIPQIMDKFGAKYEEVESYDRFFKQTLEIVFASDNKGNIKLVRDKLKFPYAFGLDVSFYKSQTHYGVYYLEVRRKGSNKGKALIKLLKYLKIKPYETIIIGDWYNDASLFEINAINVTLANGTLELKRKADIITKKDNDEGGVAELLEMIIEAKK